MLLQAHRALDNDSAGQNRRRILDALTDAPGLGFRALAAATGLPGGTIRHHLPRLERCGLITIARCGSRLFYFAGSEAASPDMLRYAVLHDLGPAWVAVHEHVAANPGQRQKDIKDAMPDHSPSTVQHRLRRLVDLGLLQQRPVGLQGVAYFPPEWPPVTGPSSFSRELDLGPGLG